ncbi:unnamed protein product [Phytomonas sp. Hart1]|nr:unnamed protein product [Phytomonas sp. Hart1]|eukprot:CCW70589.1 unnamed protein product [Phytomonas sp. isolate Hart1]
MPDFLARRPTTFTTEKDAQTWFLQHGGMHTADGAALSVPPLLRKDPLTGLFVWRTNLLKMSKVWEGWFNDLDKAFVSLTMVKMLCLANTERLDKYLTVAHMQGKFQLEVFGNSCGHYIMDDAAVELGLKIKNLVNRITLLSEKLNSRVKPRMELPISSPP